MEFHASHRYARVSARKARYVVDLVRGMAVNDALQTLKFTNRRPVHMVEKVIRSAVANAGEINPEIDAGDLYIGKAVVEEGPLLGGRVRFRPRSRGMAHPYRKRTCHIRLWLRTRPAEAESEGQSKNTAKE